MNGIIFSYRTPLGIPVETYKRWQIEVYENGVQKHLKLVDHVFSLAKGETRVIGDRNVFYFPESKVYFATIEKEISAYISFNNTISDVEKENNQTKTTKP